MKGTYGKISDYGFKGSNDYNELWNTRRVYGELGFRWDHKDSKIACAGAVRREDGIYFTPEHEGVQTYGPYFNLDPGQYEISLCFGISNVSGSLTIDVTSDVGTATLLPSQHYDLGELGEKSLKIRLDVDKFSEGVEIRTHNSGQLSGTLTSITVRHV